MNGQRQTLKDRQAGTRPGVNEASSGQRNAARALLLATQGGWEGAGSLVFREVKLPKRSGLLKCARYRELLQPSGGSAGSRTITSAHAWKQRGGRLSSRDLGPSLAPPS